MKIAVATTDKVNVSEHFGTAPYFLVMEVEEGKIVNEKARNKPCHEKFSGEEEHAQVDERGTHGFTAKASQRHKEMGEVVKDCEVIITGRMGSGAYEDFRELGLKVISTDVKDIKEAVSLCAKGELSHKEERIH